VNGGRINATIAGNTAGVGTLMSSGTVTLAGGNNITLSQNGNAVTISGANAAGGSQTLGMSNIGNTSGTSGVISGSQLRFVFAGGNNVTLSQSLNGSSGTITISAANQTVQTQNLHNVTLGGNTAGAMAHVSSGTMTLAGGNNITLSQNGNAITISGAAGGGGGEITLSRWQNMDRGTSAALAVPHNSLFLQRLNQENDLFAGNMTVNTVLFNMSGSGSTGASSTQTIAANTFSLSLGIYTPVATNNTVLTLINSASTTMGSNAAMPLFAHNHGNRWLSIHSSQWSSAPAFTQGGDYVFGVLARSAGASASRSFIGQSYMNSNQRSGYMGVSTTTGNTTMPHGNYWNAMYSVTTAALPGAISGNQVNRNNATAVFIPHILFNNQYTY
jgi:hypothetical protein